MEIKFIVKNRGEGKTKTLVDKIIDVENTEATSLIYVGSYASYLNVKHMYESIMFKQPSVKFVDKISDFKTLGREVTIFTDDFSDNVLGIIQSGPDLTQFTGTWYCTLDSSTIII